MTPQNNCEKDAQATCTLADLRAIVCRAEQMRRDDRHVAWAGGHLLVRKEGTKVDIYKAEYVQTVDVEGE